MTGFGRGEAADAHVHVTVELKAVNHRFLDVAPRLPREYATLEPSVLEIVRAALRRGRIELTVRRQASRGDAVVVADGALFRSYLAAVDELLAGRGEAEKAAAVAHVLGQPGVLTVTAAEADVDAEAPLVLAAVRDGVAALQRMREVEGRELAADLQRHVAALAAQVDAVDAVVVDLDARQRDRIQARVQKLLGEQLDPWRLAQEAAFLADKADVSEEIARLRSHLGQLREALVGDDAVGRRLDFLLQEVGREVNTLGSKAVDHPVSARVVEMKTLLERMREQAANVE